MSLMESFSILPDPRKHAKKVRHSLGDIVALAICAVLGGADDWVEVQAFGEAKESWFRQFLELPDGIPSHDTFGRVFSMIDVEAFAACFVSWASSLATLLAVLRHIAVNILRSDTSTKASLKTKRHKVGWDDDYLARLVFEG